jgi:CheY-like chemotaxis protein
MNSGPGLFFQTLGQERMPARSKPKRILIVDDEPHIQDAVSQLAAWGGFATEVAPSGSAALSLLRREAFDLVITDNRMLGMTGLELAAAIKGRWPAMPVVMFTAYPPSEPGPFLDSLLIKPTDGLNLLQTVKRLLGDSVA